MAMWPTSRIILAALLMLVCAPSSVHGSKFTSCIKHCHMKLKRQRSPTRKEKDEVRECQEECLPFHDTWEAEHNECFEKCLGDGPRDSDTKRECSRVCHRKHVAEEANRIHHYKAKKAHQKRERRAQGLPRKHEILAAKAKRPDITELDRLKDCVAECHAGKTSEEQSSFETRQCIKVCNENIFGPHPGFHPETGEVYHRHHLREEDLDMDLPDDDDDRHQDNFVWGGPLHLHSEIQHGEL